MRRSFDLLAVIALAGLAGCSANTEAEAELARQVQEQADRTAINATLVQYTTGLDMKLPDVYAGAFTADAKFMRGETPETATPMAEGTEQIRKIITDLIESDDASAARRKAEWKGEGSPPARLRHHVMTNAVVEMIDANTAEHRSYWMTVSGAGREMNVVAMGSYQDTLVKQDGKWLIKERYLLGR